MEHATMVDLDSLVEARSRLGASHRGKDVLRSLGSAQDLPTAEDIPTHGYTHGGTFHADDVFSTALLRILKPGFTGERVMAVPDDADGIVYDIGRGRFDHHQPDSPVRANGVPYASFGLLWREYGHLVLPDARDRQEFDKAYVQPIDTVDNRGGFYPLSQMVSDFNTRDTANAKAQDEAFGRAVGVAGTILGNRFETILEQRRDFEKTRSMMAACDGEVLVMDEWAHWQAAAVGSTYKFAVYESPRGGYNAQGVPDAPGSPTTVLPFPEGWRGLTGRALEDASGIPGLTFCHASGFLAAADSKEAALRAAYDVIGMGREASLENGIEMG